MNPFDDVTTDQIVDWIERRVYLVAIKQSDNLTAEQIKVYGTPTLGHKGYDKMMLSQPVHVYRKIVEIIEMYEQGVEITFPKPKTCHDIYVLCNELLVRYGGAVKSGSNLQLYSTEAILKIDEFLIKLYPLAAPFIPKKTSSETFLSSFSLRHVAKKEEKVTRYHRSVAPEIDEILFGSQVQEKQQPSDEYKPFKF